MSGFSRLAQSLNRQISICRGFWRSKIFDYLLSWKVLIYILEKSELAQSSVLADPRSTATPSLNNNQNVGLEVLETLECLDSLDYVLSAGGPERAGRLLQ